MIFVFEKLKTTSLLFVFFKLEKNSRLRVKPEIYYFDSSKYALKIFNILAPIIKYKPIKLNFLLRNIRTKKNELYRLFLARKNLLDWQTKVCGEKNHSSFFEAYLKKSQFNDDILNSSSLSRVLFCIQVIKNKVPNYKKDFIFFITKTNVPKKIKNNLKKERIKILVLQNTKLLNKYRNFILKHFFNLVIFSKNLIKLLKNIKSDDISQTSTIYVEGRGDVNLKNDGYPSDFFWAFNNKKILKSIVYQASSSSEYHQLSYAGVIQPSFNPRILFLNLFQKKNLEIFFHGKTKHLKHAFYFERIRRWWHLIFQSNNCKIFVTWDRYSPANFAVGQAMHDLGGVSVLLPIAFDGFQGISLQSKFDINFCFSKFSAGIDQSSGCQCDYQIITGYPRDYSKSLLEKPAKKLRSLMQLAGASKIICGLDENSADDDRWHTGHPWQQENYSFLCEAVLRHPWLGVIFKPKNAKTLRHRLGPVANLLRKAEKTRRCFVFEEVNRHTTKAPPLLPALAADLVVHGHLCAGTAALETALAGIPTLLIDRERPLGSVLGNLPEGKVVFSSWNEATEAILTHFSKPKGIPKFGQWGALLDILDPFRDGLAAKRIESFMVSLREGFENNWRKTKVINAACDQYAQRWGKDKVLSCS